MKMLPWRIRLFRRAWPKSHFRGPDDFAGNHGDRRRNSWLKAAESRRRLFDSAGRGRRRGRDTFRPSSSTWASPATLSIALGFLAKKVIRSGVWVLLAKMEPTPTTMTTSFLRNKYWENGTGPEYALASEGINQAHLAGQLFLKELKENNIPIEDVRICYSPFSRTTHTAKVVASVLSIPFEGSQCKAIEDLRERYFGPSFELQSHDKYPEIWALHEKNPFTRAEEGGESVDDVASRLTRALATMEAQFQGCNVLVVSHGDPLQILQTILTAAKQHTGPGCDDLESRIKAARISPIMSQHRNFSLLTGELRAVM
ncbi:hypothetical protein TIFTF001_019246 [Ficus carica]|uniref:Uncharacterized protein n=1 Tax=Ficus carica TaxID=3494 RepID=A0AA88AQ35_FICCA|nr:hypothetical protein TIFTF001_019246 [Ficus carica]